MFRLSFIILCAVGVLLCILPACDSTCILVPLTAACVWVGIIRTLYRKAI